MNDATTHNQLQPTGSRGFAGLGLSNHFDRTLREVGYLEPTPIQAQAISHVLAGKDLLGCAQTGTGKTAAFALPILQRILSKDLCKGRLVIQTLVLAPTRELAAQIGTSFERYAAGRARLCVVFGGVSKQGQVRTLRRGVDVLVATPGRLLDLMGDGVVKLDHVETFVLDEADRMLDMGFIHDVRRITRALPIPHQTLMFSATMTKEIQALATRVLRSPVRVAVDPVSSTCEPIEQSVYHVDKASKTSLLVQLLKATDIDRALVFTRTKHGANKVVRSLVKSGFGAAAIHGNKSQGARTRALEDFKQGRIRVVVATDLAARGLDIKDLSHVINFDLPNEPEGYVHRVGRTGRAGASGIALSFCSGEERDLLRSIERLTRRRLAPCTMPEGLARPSRSEPVQQRAKPKAAARPSAGSSTSWRPSPPRRRGSRRRGGIRAPTTLPSF